ncbi:MAG: Uracil phosphoribosyltransferase, partial [uncultured Gemmatimonadaceae bacterium]
GHHPRVSDALGRQAPAGPPQAHPPARPAHAEEDLQGAGGRDRDAHGLRGDERPRARGGGGGHPARADDRAPGEREEAHARPDPARGARPGGGGAPAGAERARGAHRPVPRPRHAAAGGLLLQGAERRLGAGLLPPRPDARHRGERGERGGLPQAGRRGAHPLPLPRRRPRGRPSARGRAPRREHLRRRARPRAQRAGVHLTRLGRCRRSALRHAV